jgi:hypothetical protein
MNKRLQATIKRLFHPINSTIHQPYTGKNRSVGWTIGVTSMALVVVLAACGPTGNALTPTPTTVIGSLPNPVNMPTTANTTVPPSTPTSLDPCQVITSQVASSLAGASYGAGEESTTQGGGKICTYGSQTTNVFMVEVDQAPDVATAQAEKAQFVSDLEAKLPKLTGPGLSVTELPNFADGAVLGVATINSGGVIINGGAIGVLKGTIFFGFSDLVVGGPAPTSAALQAEAQTILGTLP